MEGACKATDPRQEASAVSDPLNRHLSLTRKADCLLPRMHPATLCTVTTYLTTDYLSVDRFLRAEVTGRLQRMRDEAAPRKTWPEGCYGSAVSWLLFVGPSPGGKPGPRHDPRRRNRTGGRCHWNVDFDEPYADRPDAWGGKYRENIPALVETIIGLPLHRGSAKLYGFANFDWVPSSQECRVPRTRLQLGERDVLRVLKSARPRVIAPTTNHAHVRLLHCLRREGYTFRAPAEQSVRIRIDPRGDSFHSELEIVQIRGRGVLSGSIVVRLPQHPARMLYRQHGHRCARAIRRAVVQVYGESHRLAINEV